MRFYVGDMDPEDFVILLGHARQLSHRQHWRARDAAAALRAAGPLAVRPLACTIEAVLQDPSSTDEAVDAHAERAAAVVRSIGAPAAPTLASLVDEEACNLYVREWAQDMLFEALGLRGAARHAACRHLTRMRLDGDRTWTCLSCEAGFGDGEHPTEGPVEAPKGPGKGGGRAKTKRGRTQSARAKRERRPRG